MTLNTAAFARLLALFALLCTLGLQAGEAQHNHGIDEQAAECLLCKGSSGTDAALPECAYTRPEGICHNNTPTAVLPVQTRPTTPSARGPPIHS